MQAGGKAGDLTIIYALVFSYYVGGIDNRDIYIYIHDITAPYDVSMPMHICVHIYILYIHYIYISALSAGFIMHKLSNLSTSGVPSLGNI